MKQTLILFLVFYSLYGMAQDQVPPPKAKAKVKISGGIGINAQMYNAFGEEDRYSPWQVGFAGNLNIAIGKFKVPVSFYFSENGISAYNNFNRIGVSPTYKKLKFHLGYRSMQFSPYVLNGTTFFGAGVEYNHKLRFAAMTGRLKNISLLSSARPIFGIKSLNDYSRNATAFKLGYGSDSKFFDLIFFHSSDQDEDLLASNFNEQLDYRLLPKENLAIGSNFSLNIAKTLYLSGNVMTSALSENSLADPTEIDKNLEFITGIFQPNKTTILGYAGKFNVGLKLGKLNVDGQYERISPQFETLGRYYGMKDTDRKQARIRYSKKGFSVNASYGIELNEVAETNINTNQRTIFSFAASARVSSQIKIRAAYSNFNLDNSPSVVEDNDSLKLVRVLSNGRVSATVNLKGKLKQKIAIRANYRSVDNQFAFENASADVNLYGGRLTYSFVLPSELSVGVNSSYQQYNIGDITRQNYRFGTNLSKRLLQNKLNLAFNSQYTITNVIGKSNGFAISSSLNSSYQVSEKSAVSLNIIHFNRNRNVGENFNEMRSRFNYRYNF